MFADHEASDEIVEAVPDFLEGSPMRPTIPFVKKGRLPPKKSSRSPGQLSSDSGSTQTNKSPGAAYALVPDVQAGMVGIVDDTVGVDAAMQDGSLAGRCRMRHELHASAPDLDPFGVFDYVNSLASTPREAAAYPASARGCGVGRALDSTAAKQTPRGAARARGVSDQFSPDSAYAAASPSEKTEQDVDTKSCCSFDEKLSPGGGDRLMRIVNFTSAASSPGLQPLQMRSPARSRGRRGDAAGTATSHKHAAVSQPMLPTVTPGPMASPRGATSQCALPAVLPEDTRNAAAPLVSRPLATSSTSRSPASALKEQSAHSSPVDALSGSPLLSTSAPAAAGFDRRSPTVPQQTVTTRQLGGARRLTAPALETVPKPSDPGARAADSAAATPSAVPTRSIAAPLPSLTPAGISKAAAPSPSVVPQAKTTLTTRMRRRSSLRNWHAGYDVQRPPSSVGGPVKNEPAEPISKPTGAAAEAATLPARRTTAAPPPAADKKMPSASTASPAQRPRRSSIAERAKLFERGADEQRGAGVSPPLTTSSRASTAGSSTGNPTATVACPGSALQPCAPAAERQGIASPRVVTLPTASSSANAPVRDGAAAGPTAPASSGAAHQPKKLPLYAGGASARVASQPGETANSTSDSPKPLTPQAGAGVPRSRRRQSVHKPNSRIPSITEM